MTRKVTTKGQVTIPQEIRDALAIHPGATVEFSVSGSDVVLHKVAGGRGAAIVSRMRGRASGRMTTDQIMRLTRS
jgi:AbrB family looped-hinge helix DNA binding protein